MSNQGQDTSLEQYLAQRKIGLYEYKESKLPSFIYGKQKGGVLLLSRNEQKNVHESTDLVSIKNEQYHTVYEMANQVVDVCFLSGRATKALLSGLPGSAKYIFVRARINRHSFIAFLGLARRLITKQLTIQGIKTLQTEDSPTRWILLYRKKITMPTSGCMTLSSETGVQAFLDHLREAKARYVVLRFYENLPELGRDGGDIDILVMNEDEYIVREFLKKYPGDIKVDIWPVSNPNFSSASYYPTPLARSIIEHAVDGPANSRIPAPREAFLSFAYHAVYHKGPFSGLSTIMSDITVNKNPENDYAGKLAVLARAQGVDISITLESVDEYLKQEGWQPKLDTLAKISPHNKWVQKRFFSNQQNRDIGLRVFIIREKAVQKKLVDSILKTITESGEFIILRKKFIEKERIQYVADHIRGGVWTDQVKNVHIYLPAIAVVVVDLHTAHHAQLKSKSSIDFNIRTKNLKKFIREKFDEESTSLVHATDETNESWEYIETCFPGEVANIKAEVEKLCGSISLSWLQRVKLYIGIAPMQWMLYKNRLRERIVRGIVE